MNRPIHKFGKFLILLFISLLKFEKKYVQIGMHWNFKFWGLSFTNRIGQLKYVDGNVYGKIENSEMETIETLKSNNSFQLRESSFRVHLGVKQVRLFFNFTSLIETTDLEELGVEQTISSIGCFVEIDEFFRKS